MEIIVDQMMTLHEFLKLKQFSRKFIRSHYKNDIKVNGNHRKLYEKVKIGEKIEIDLTEKTNIKLVEHPINIVYEDSELLIIYKEKNIPVIGTKKHYNFHLSGMILNYYQKYNINSTIHFVNRLDKDTEGLVIIAKNGYIHNLMKNIKIKKKYYCLIEGRLQEKGIAIFKIKKDTLTGKRIVSDQGKECITYYQTKEIVGNNTLMDVDLITGRTHQIRVCFKYLKHPLIGDILYNSSNYKSNEEFYLKNYYIKFIHPISNKVVEIEV